MRFAVIGLFSSGSTGIARMLDCLGVDMGRPFHLKDIPGDKANFYEPKDLSEKLRVWWNEPQMETTTPRQVMVSELHSWIQVRENHAERRGVRDVGAKHPILSMCAPELVQAWGADTKFIWSWREFDKSVASLRRRTANGGFGNFKGHEEATQRKLWDALNRFADSNPEIVRMNWVEVLTNPESFARQLAGLCSEMPSENKITAATKCIDVNHGS